jgi:hypothetical protein
MGMQTFVQNSKDRFPLQMHVRFVIVSQRASIPARKEKVRAAPWAELPAGTDAKPQMYLSASIQKAVVIRHFELDAEEPYGRP